MQRARIEWEDLVAFEPTLEDVETHLDALTAAYNDPNNAPLLGHTSDMAPEEVVEHYHLLITSPNARPFILTRGDALVGDGDLRGIAGEAAEFAFLIADPGEQGRGLGTRFALMVHAFAFEALGLARVFASVVPANIASRRVFEKLGYTEDPNEAYGDLGDVTLGLDRETFLRVNASFVREIEISLMG
ncbi:MAG: GNAT family N-acetyltransferase [Kofleriaceae bacterium]